MAVIKDALVALLKGANPDQSDEDIQARADLLSQHPDAIKAMEPLMSDQSYGAAPTTSAIPADIAAPVPIAPNAQFTPDAAATPTPTPAPSAPVATAPAPTAVQPTPTPSINPVMSNDNNTRNAANAAALQERKRNIIPAALGGIGDALATGASAFGAKTSADTENKILEQGEQDFEKNKSLAEDKIKHDPNSDISKSYRDMVTQIAPGIAKDPNFQGMSAQDIGDKLPLIDTMMKAKASEDARKMSLAQIQSNKEISLGLRQDQQQDKLEQNAKQMVSNLRGDRSLARTEEQRDAASTVVNRINEVKQSGAGLNPFDYADMLGQLYKARSGSAPDAQMMKDIKQPTGSAAFNHAWTYLSGQQAPATTNSIADSLLQAAQSMGKQADTFHDGYMKSHLIKPKGLEDDRWQPILQTGRGISFADATKQAAGSSNSTSDPLGIR